MSSVVAGYEFAGGQCWYGDLIFAAAVAGAAAAGLRDAFRAEKFAGEFQHLKAAAAFAGGVCG